MRSITLRGAALAALAAASSAATIRVCCDCASRVGDFTSIREAQAHLRTARATDAGAWVVEIDGTCRESLTFGPADGGSPTVPVIYKSAPGSDPASISGGVPIMASYLQPVTDAAVLAQIQPAAVSAVRQVDLSAAGVADLGTLVCHAYEGGEASVLPGNLRSAGLELFMLGDPTTGGDASPLVLARFPNVNSPPHQWANSTGVDGYSGNFSVGAAAAARLPLWRQQLQEDSGSVYAHYLNKLGWADHHNQVLDVLPLGGSGANVTLAPCVSEYNEPSDDSLDVGGGAYIYNLLSELDMPGEYYLNRTSGMLYVWPPTSSDAIWTTSPWGAPVVPSEAAPRSSTAARGTAIAAGRYPRVTSTDGDSVVGFVSIADQLLTLTDVSWLTFEGLVFEFARGGAVVTSNASNIVFSSVLIQNAGNMALNVTDGSGVQLVDSEVRHAGNGAVNFYAGDRTTLTASGHLVANSTLSYSNRYMFCYVPMASLNGVGAAVVDSELFGGPHQGVFASGNNHLLQGCHLHDLVQGALDSGAFYAGRDWTYQGTVIAGNTFARISSLSGPDTSAVYLDDMVSGFTTVNNTFLNVSRVYLLGGGRSNTFSGNTINGVTGTDAALHVDNRGMNWQSKSCTPPSGELVQFLNRVPYNSSQVWETAYPQLPGILGDDPCVPKHNSIIGNRYCNVAGGLQFIDQTNATLAGWGVVAYGNAQGC